MNSTKYIAPSIDVLEIELESVILTASGEDAIPGFGE